MILERIINQIAAQQKEYLLRKDAGQKRELTLPVENLQSHALIISGFRRCGKSTLLLQLMQQMQDKSVFFLNFDTPQLYGFNVHDFSRLDNIISHQTAKTLFFDEIQLVEGWEMYVRQKLDEGFKLIATGSNAAMLSMELGTRLTGRHITKELFPFSYSEFLQFRNTSASPESLKDYLVCGGFPEYLKSGNEEILLMLYDDILKRDIQARFGIKDATNLLRLANYLMANAGNRISASRLRQPLSIGATSTVLNWFSYLEQSYLFHFLPKFSYSSKAQLVNPRKVYAVDTGMLHALSVSKTEDSGRKLENLIFLHLRKKYRELYYFDDKGECDFVAYSRGQVFELVQVCYELTAENLDREISGLLSALKFFKMKTGKIITLSDSDIFEKDGYEIKVIPAHEYLT